MDWLKSYKTTICGAILFVIWSLQAAGVNLGHVGTVDSLQFGWNLILGLGFFLGADASELEKLKAIIGK